MIYVKMISSADIVNIIRTIVGDDVDINSHSPLVGGSSQVDSMGLVQICLALEDRSQAEGFAFDWTSEKAMSSLNSIFRTSETLACEYNRQYSESQK